MSEDFKKFLCEKTSEGNITRLIHIQNGEPEQAGKDLLLLILIKAMFAINRENYIEVGIGRVGVALFNNGSLITTFDYCDHNNSEQQALEAALIFIWEQEKTNEV